MTLQMLLVLLTTFLEAYSEANLNDILLQLSNIPEDGLLNFTQLVTKYGWSSEEFDIVTEDGYILKLFHIKGNEGQKPVLLMHGILDSADTFVIRGKISIAINLAEAGYDVWAGNVRGNKYTTRHVTLSPEIYKQEFWNFSFHEMGVLDLPVTIDFILEKTGKASLSAVGHSQGTTMFYVLGSVKPEYNKKVSVFISLAPIAYLNDISPALAGAVTMFPLLNSFLMGLGIEGFLQEQSLSKRLIQFVCSQGQIAYVVCENIFLEAVAGHDPEELQEDFFHILLGHFLVGTSRKSLVHYVQVSKSNRFAQFDYGIAKNLMFYESLIPPAYNLSNAKMPIVLMVGKNDGISGVKDAERLKRELPNAVLHKVERDRCNHNDYLWGRHLYLYITPVLRRFLKMFA